MKVALGLKAHSGWAALVAVGISGREFHVLDRRRIELVKPGEVWAKQPYHAAEALEPSEANRLVKQGIESARQLALQEIRAALERACDAGHTVAACAVLVGEAMPDWTVDEILAVHFRMHKAEGVLFREALLQAGTELGIKSLPVPEKLVTQDAAAVLGKPVGAVMQQLATFGKALGSPWGKDQKDATLAAMIALRT